MNKTQTKKLAALVAKSANQEDAVLSYFASGNDSITRDGAQSAGIGDPKRVVNRLRSNGVKVVRAKVVTRNTSDITYSLADKQPKKVQKQLAALA